MFTSDHLCFFENANNENVPSDLPCFFENGNNENVPQFPCFFVSSFFVCCEHFFSKESQHSPTTEMGMSTADAPSSFFTCKV